MCNVLLNSSSGFGGDVITVKMKDGCRRPYLLTDTTRPPLGEQVSNKSDQWSWRRYDNEQKFTDVWNTMG